LDMEEVGMVVMVLAGVWVGAVVGEVEDGVLVQDLVIAHGLVFQGVGDGVMGLITHMAHTVLVTTLMEGSIPPIMDMEQPLIILHTIPTGVCILNNQVLNRNRGEKMNTNYWDNRWYPPPPPPWALWWSYSPYFGTPFDYWNNPFLIRKLSPQEELRLLKAQESELVDELEMVRKRIKELEEKNENTGNSSRTNP